MRKTSKSKNTETKYVANRVANQRLRVLELARELGSVAEACRRMGMDRSSFYEWRRRYQAHGFDGLKDRPPVHKSHPQSTPPHVVERIKELALAHPAYGCNRHETTLAQEGVRVSAVTIQKILKQEGLGTKYSRWIALERDIAEKAIDISVEQATFLENHNPCFRERHAESSAPGELLSVDIFQVAKRDDNEKIYLHAVVDTFSSFAFGVLSISSAPLITYSLLSTLVLDDFLSNNLSVLGVITGSRFDSREKKSLNNFTKRLKKLGIEHYVQPNSSVNTNGYIERFKAIARNEFFQVEAKNVSYETFDALRDHFALWLVHYNGQRPHHGYPNMGRTPVEVLMPFLAQQAQVD